MSESIFANVIHPL